MEKPKEYRTIVYDGFLQDYIWESESFYYTRNEAIFGAMDYYQYIDPWIDEVHLYIRTLGMGEWQMFGYITEDEDGNLCVEECFC